MIAAISSEAIPSPRVKPVARMSRADDRRRDEREHQGPLRIGPMASLAVNGTRIEVPHMHFFRYDAEGRLIGPFSKSLPSQMREATSLDSVR
jgi:hypothetical protein